MSTTQVRDRNNKMVGSMITRPNGVVEVRDTNYHLLGVYEPAVNITRDASGRRVGTGNLLATFLRI